jgi:hypothetical protein
VTTGSVSNSTRACATIKRQRSFSRRCSSTAGRREATFAIARLSGSAEARPLRAAPCCSPLTPILPAAPAWCPARDRRGRVGRLAPRRHARRHAGLGAPARACGDRAPIPLAISRRGRRAEGRAGRPPQRHRRRAPWGRGGAAHNPLPSHCRANAALPPRHAARGSRAPWWR